MYHFIVNPASRTGLGMKVWEQVEEELKHQNIAYHVYFTKYPYHSQEITRKICANHQGPLTLAVLGGDGSVNEVLSSIPAEDLDRITFAYLPSGSSNDLARGLIIPREPVAALQNILHPKHYLDMDYGTIRLGSEEQLHRFAVSASIGFDAGVCEEVQISPVKKFLNKLKLGKLSYLVIAIKQLITCHTADMTIRIDDGEPVTYKKVLFTAAMNQRCEGGGLIVAPEADPADHLLSMCIVHDFPKLKALILLPALVLGGKHTHFRNITMVDCRKAEISASEPLCIHSDGEVRGHYDQVTFSCSDGTIRVPVTSLDMSKSSRR